MAWYAASVGATALVPWLAVLLTDRGWSDTAATAWLVAIPLGRLLAAPGWAWVADRVGSGPVVRVALAVALGCAIALVAARDPWLAPIAILGWTWARAPVFPIVDATAIGLLGRRYGPVRAVGSVAYLTFAGLGGFVHDRWPLGPAIGAAALSAASLALSFPLPALAPRRSTGADWTAVLRDPVLTPLVAVCVAHGAAIAAYDHLYAVHVRHLGLPSWVTGAGIALGVGVEVVVLANSERLLARFGAVPLFAAAVAVGVPRFAITAVTTDPVLLVATQALHGINFGAFWLGGTTVFAERAPDSLRSTTQALLPAAAFGAGPVIGLGLATALLARFDTGMVFAVASATSAVATLGLLGWLRGRRG